MKLAASWSSLWNGCQVQDIVQAEAHRNQGSNDTRKPHQKHRGQEPADEHRIPGSPSTVGFLFSEFVSALHLGWLFPGVDPLSWGKKKRDVISRIVKGDPG